MKPARLYTVRAAILTAPVVPVRTPSRSSGRRPSRRCSPSCLEPAAPAEDTPEAVSRWLRRTRRVRNRPGAAEVAALEAELQIDGGTQVGPRVSAFCTRGVERRGRRRASTSAARACSSWWRPPGLRSVLRRERLLNERVQRRVVRTAATSCRRGRPDRPSRRSVAAKPAGVTGATEGVRYCGPTAQPVQDQGAREGKEPAAHRANSELRRAPGGGRLRRLALRLGQLLGHPAHGHVEHRREHEAEQRHADHAEQHGGAQRLAHLVSRPLGEGQRDHAEDEGEGGHQDGPQPRARRLLRGLPAVHAVQLLRLLGELHDQDGVLGRQPDQHDQAHLRKNVVVEPPQVHAQERRQDAHGNDQDHRHRQGHALVERRQQQKGENHRHDEGEAAGRAGGGLLVGDLRPLVAEARGKGLVGDPLHGRQRLAGGVAGRAVALNLGGGIEIVAQDAVRTGDVLQRDDRSQGRHAARGRAGPQPQDVALLPAPRPVRLRTHLVGIAQVGEVVDVA